MFPSPYKSGLRLYIPVGTDKWQEQSVPRYKAEFIDAGPGIVDEL